MTALLYRCFSLLKPFGQVNPLIFSRPFKIFRAAYVSAVNIAFPQYLKKSVLGLSERRRTQENRPLVLVFSPFQKFSIGN